MIKKIIEIDEFVMTLTPISDVMGAPITSGPVQTFVLHTKHNRLAS